MKKLVQRRGRPALMPRRQSMQSMPTKTRSAMCQRTSTEISSDGVDAICRRVNKKKGRILKIKVCREMRSEATRRLATASVVLIQVLASHFAFCQTRESPIADGNSASPGALLALGKSSS